MTGIIFRERNTRLKKPFAVLFCATSPCCIINQLTSGLFVALRGNETESCVTESQRDTMMRQVNYWR